MSNELKELLQTYANKHPEFAKQFATEEDMLNAIRNNPDILMMSPDKSRFTERTNGLEHCSWIDRAAGDYAHFNDENGTWIDGIGFSDDQEKTEMDLSDSPVMPENDLSL